MQREPNPGPAAYSNLNEWGPKVPKERKRPYTARVQNRHRREEDITPGPSDYSPKYPQSARGFSFTKAPQRNRVKRDETPSPADFDTRSKTELGHKSPAFLGPSRGNVFPDQTNDATVIPIPKWGKVKQNPHPFGTERSFPVKEAVDVFYEPPPTRKPGRITFGLDRKPYSISDNPGPGSYDIPRDIGGERMISRLGRGEVFPSKDTPGPGSYETQRAQKIQQSSKAKRQSPAFKRSVDRDSYIRKEVGPGPADFTIQQNERRIQSSISTTPRCRHNEYIGGLPIDQNPCGADYQKVVLKFTQ